MSDISKIQPGDGNTYDVKDITSRKSIERMVDSLSGGTPGSRNARNIIPYPYIGGNYKEHNGVKFVVNRNGSITVTGTISEGEDYAWFDICPGSIGYNKYIIDNTEYKLLGAPAGGAWSEGNHKWQLYLYTSESGNPTAAADKGSGAIFTGRYIDYSLRIIVGREAGDNINLTFYPMIVPTYCGVSLNTETGSGFWAPVDCSNSFSNQVYYTFGATSGTSTHYAAQNKMCLPLPTGGTGILIGGQFGNSMIGSQDNNVEIPEGEIDSGLPYVIAFVGGQGNYQSPQLSKIRYIKKQDAKWVGGTGALVGHTTSIALSQEMREDNRIWVTMKIQKDGADVPDNEYYYLQAHIIFLPNIYKIPFINWEDIPSD